MSPAFYGYKFRKRDQLGTSFWVTSKGQSRLRPWQKAVIGKTSIEGGAETVFVVVTGTIVD